jgi:hypothetical protein
MGVLNPLDDPELATIAKLPETDRMAIFLEVTNALHDEDKEVRKAAAFATFKLIKTVRGARDLNKSLPNIFKSLASDPDQSVRQFLAWTTISMERSSVAGHPGALKLLEGVALKDEAKLVRYEVARAAVIHFGANAEAVVPTLIANMQDSSIQVLSGSSATSTAGGEGTKAGTNVQQSAEGDGRVLPAEILYEFVREQRDSKRKLNEAVRQACEIAKLDSNPNLAALAREMLKLYPKP